jgi:hypothetical protein
MNAFILSFGFGIWAHFFADYRKKNQVAWASSIFVSA